MECPPRIKKIAVAQIDRTILQDPDFYNIIKNNIMLSGKRKCPQKHCSGFETTTLNKLGNFLQCMLV